MDDLHLYIQSFESIVVMVQKEDVENVIRLIYETLLTINPKDSLSYFD